jgi:hypothetical protein
MGPLALAGAKAGLALATQVGGSLVQHGVNQRSQQKAYEQNVQFWQNRFDQTNAYNHPVQQMARMKEAGLNPALMYGQSATGAAGNAGSQSAEGKKAAQMTGLSNLGLTSLQAQDIQTNMNLKQQDIALRGVQIGTETARKAKTWSEAKQAEHLAEWSYDIYRYQFREQMYRAINTQIGAQIRDETKKAEVANILANYRINVAKAENIENENKLFNMTRDSLMRAGINPAMVINLIKLIK